MRGEVMVSPRYIWLVSYPRSGNTWLRLALEALCEGAVPYINHPRLSIPITNRVEFDEILCVESSELTDAEVEDARPGMYRALADNRPLNPILRKVHDRYWHTRDGQPAFTRDLSRGAIYLVRDPRDVAVSLGAFWDRNIDWVIDFMADKTSALARPGRGMIDQFQQPLGAWSDHVSSWLDDARLPIHLLRYEDMLADPSRRIAEAARFAGLNDEYADLAVSATSFKALQEQEATEGFLERPATARQFFRQGRAGAWRHVLTVAQRSRIEHDHGAAMHRLGYE